MLGHRPDNQLNKLIKKDVETLLDNLLLIIKANLFICENTSKALEIPKQEAQDQLRNLIARRESRDDPPYEEDITELENLNQILDDRINKYKHDEPYLLRLKYRYQKLENLLTVAKKALEEKSNIEFLPTLISDSVLGMKSDTDEKKENLEFVKPSHDYIPAILKQLTKINRFIEINLNNPQSFTESEYRKIRGPSLPITEVFIKPTTKPKKEEIIPNIIHYHWYGKPMPVEYIKNILQAKFYNPAEKIIVWTDNPNHLFKNAANLGLDEETLQSSVEIRTIQDLLNDAKTVLTLEAFLQVEKILLDERTGLINYAACSDLARQIALLIYGGKYLDTDIVVTRPFDSIPFLYGYKHPEVNNYLIITTPNHPIVRATIENMLQQYTKMTNTWFLAEIRSLEVTDPKVFDITNKNPDLVIGFEPFSLLSLKRTPERLIKFFSIEATLFGATDYSRRSLTIDLGPGCVSKAVRSFADAEKLKSNDFEFKEKDIRVKTKIGNRSCSVIDYGGTYAFSDQTWVPKELRCKALEIHKIEAPSSALNRRYSFSGSRILFPKSSQTLTPKQTAEAKKKKPQKN
ncbi:MAG: glycosyltransferase family 32 protein [Gammaproteobacteria bacterium]